MQHFFLNLMAFCNSVKGAFIVNVAYSRATCLDDIWHLVGDEAVSMLNLESTTFFQSTFSLPLLNKYNFTLKCIMKMIPSIHPSILGFWDVFRPDGIHNPCNDFWVNPALSKLDHLKMKHIKWFFLVQSNSSWTPGSLWMSELLTLSLRLTLATLWRKLILAYCTHFHSLPEACDCLWNHLCLG